jgi:acyl carrier protein
MNNDFIQRRIRFLLETVLLVPAECINMDLVESGVIDSAGFMELFFLLEREFGVEVKAVDLELENFRSVTRMTEFVLCKRADQPADERENNGGFQTAAVRVADL